MENYILIYAIIGVLVTIYFDIAIKSNPHETEPLSVLEQVSSILLWPIVVGIWIYAWIFIDDQE